MRVLRDTTGLGCVVSQPRDLVDTIWGHFHRLCVRIVELKAVSRKISMLYELEMVSAHSNGPTNAIHQLVHNRLSVRRASVEVFREPVFSQIRFSTRQTFAAADVTILWLYGHERR